MLFSNNLKVSKTIIEDVWESEDFADVTLVTSDDHQINVHKLILSAHSKVFRNILLKAEEQNPLLYLMGIKYRDLVNVLKFLYLGKCEVEGDNIPQFLSLAKELDISGLYTENTDKNEEQCNNTHLELGKELLEIQKTNDFQDNYITYKEDEKTKQSMLNSAKNIEIDQYVLLLTKNCFEDQNDESNENKGYSNSLMYISNITEVFTQNAEAGDFVKEELGIPNINGFQDVTCKYIPDDSSILKKEEETKQSVKNNAKYIGINHQEFSITTDNSESRNGERIVKDDIEMKKIKNNEKHLQGISNTEAEPTLGKDINEKEKINLNVEAGEIDKAGQFFICKRCNVTHDNIEQLRRHRSIHKKARQQVRDPFFCDKCDKQFPQASRLRKHIVKFHDWKLYNCDLCGKGLRSAYSMRKHRRQIHEARFYCGQCDANFRLEDALNNHIEFQHTGNIGRYDCHDCYKSFTTNANLTDHKNFVHKGLYNKCNLCNETFTSKGSKRNHQITKHTGKTFFCHLCEKSFLWQNNLITHIGSKHEGKKIDCGDCPSSFAYRTHFITHKKMKHPKSIIEPTFKCSQCEKGFGVERYLITHIKRMHEGTPGKYDCDKCDKNFQNMGSLEAHEKSRHEGIRYHCDFCEANYSDKDYLKRHIMKKHAVH